ncbi:tRNA-dihydrouridine synthase family protein [Sanguibacteroides justesenii]|uniref:tRNA-dihydrouridine synthase n=1 Tax=Sanguibacteroides justesenii TaxID=1547597 RepID=A0AB34R8V6_9PORP|nr:tRNA-dihydrouridine synthase family protein [Sanguibacteroides justesenii]KIO45291.1 dihydrouridine synthase [Sanguibacteroides justesenii]
MELKDYKIHFAPVQGHTDWIYRNLHEKHFGGIDAYYTPFIRVEKGNGFRTKDLRDITPEINRVGELIPQVLGGDPDELRVMLAMLADKGYGRVDLNLGCPFSMIARKGKGAGILSYPEKVAALMDVIGAFPVLHCSVKMRLGWESPEEGMKLLPVLNEAPLKAVILHARVGVQEYGGEVNREAFRAFYEGSRHPLYYNGDIRTLEDIREVVTCFPLLEGVMIGRGLLANPALAMEYRENRELCRENRLRTFREFHDELFEQNGERLQGDHQLLMKMKTFWEYFLPETDRKVLKKIKKANKVTQYNDAVAEAFKE